jgi:UDP-2-acetamido-3-amino-2,3-dideoxy-glucuronate N-acetyltransferase
MPAEHDALLTDYRADTAYIHESSYVDAPCRIGEHTAILHFTHIMSRTIIGDHCHIGRNVSIASGVLVGNHVKVMNNAQLNGGVILENSVYCGPSVTFTDNRNVRAVSQGISKVSPTLVRQGAHLGPNATVSSGFTIGRFSFIEAGTIVDRNIPDFAIVCGNPLKFAGWRCECGQSLVSQSDPSSHSSEVSMTCAHCGRRYQRQSKWKVLQLAQEDSAFDPDSEFDPSVRTAERFD